MQPPFSHLAAPRGCNASHRRVGRARTRIRVESHALLRHFERGCVLRFAGGVVDLLER
jgi:hypothetical protein